VLDQLVERGPEARYHIGGGEPFLDVERLARAVAGMERRGLALDYVETNASWVRGREHAEQVLRQLSAEGLGCVLVSLSPFHAEHVPLARTLCLIEAAEQVLAGGAFVWIPDFMRDLARFPLDQRVALDELLAERGESYARQLAARYSLVPAGRAGRFLARHGLRLRWQEAARSAPCRTRLSDTSHFHVDGQGRYVPGLCAGLALPLERVPGEIPLAAYPLLRALVEGGPAALVALAAEQGGFEPDVEGYSSGCDLCTHVRGFLHGEFPGRYEELGPEGFYAEPWESPSTTKEQR
jgi:hypothetical protein